MKKLSVKSKLAYGVGDVGLGLTVGMLGVLFLKFLTDFQGLDPFLAGIAIAIPRIWDGISDPIMGSIADRTKSKMGSYRPYLLYGAIPFALAFFAMWLIPDLSQVGKLVYYGFMFLLFDTFVTIVFIPYSSLTTRLTNDYDERTSLTTFRMVFSLSAMMIANIVPITIIGPMKRVSESGAISYASHTTIMLVVGVIALVAAAAFITTALGTREMKLPPKPRTKVKDFVKTSIRNKPYLLAAGMYLVTILSFDITIGAFLYYFENSMGIASTTIPLGLMFIFALVSVPLVWDKLAKRYDKVTAFMIGSIIMMAMRTVTLFIPRGTPIWILYILCVVAGTGFGAGQTLPWAIMPDTMDYAEYKTGKRNDAMMYSIMTSCRKLISAVTPLIIGAALALGHYNSDMAIQPQSADIAIRVLFGVIPSIFVVLGILMAKAYPLKRSDSEMITAELERRRLEAEEQP